MRAKKRAGSLLIVLGCLCILAALLLLLYNRHEAAEADRFSRSVLPRLTEDISSRAAETAAAPVPAAPPETDAAPAGAITPPPAPTPPPPMGSVSVDGYDYIGTLRLPALGLELPIMKDWSYAKLNLAPCCYSGSVYTDDLVLMAHNFPLHFGRIAELNPGDTVEFRDADGVVWEYRVAAEDVLPPEAVEDMRAGDWPLTLFTCSYGGKSRVTVRCEAVQESLAEGDFS